MTARPTFFPKRIRKLLRKALGVHESKADVYRLMSVLCNKGQRPEVHEAAMHEIKKRYFVALNARGDELVSKIMVGKQARVTERVVLDPLSIMNETNAELFERQHRKRCDVWILVEAEDVPQEFVGWFALSLHWQHCSMRLRSVEAIAEAIPGTEAPKFRESLYGIGKKNWIWIGANYEPGKPHGFLPLDHELYSKKYVHLVRPFCACCHSCLHGDWMRQFYTLAKCPGSTGWIHSQTLHDLVSEHGCHAYRYVQCWSSVTDLDDLM